MRLRRRKSRPARAADKLHDLARGPATTVQGAGRAGRAAGRGGKAMAVYAGRKAKGKRAPLLVGLPAFAGASIAGFFAIRKVRRGIKQTAPD
jgi:hypothetical protein